MWRITFGDYLLRDHLEFPRALEFAALIVDQKQRNLRLIAPNGVRMTLATALILAA